MQTIVKSEQKLEKLSQELSILDITGTSQKWMNEIKIWVDGKAILSSF